MLEALEKVFERKSSLTIMYVMKKLLKLKYNCGEDLQEHFVKTEMLLREVESLQKTKLEDADKVCYLLLSMPEAYDNIIMVIETLNDDKWTYAFVKTCLLDEEMKQ